MGHCLWSALVMWIYILVMPSLSLYYEVLRLCA